MKEKLLEKLHAEGRNRLPVVGLAALVAVILLWALIARVIVPNNRYNGAKELQAAGKYQQAAEMFTALGDYRDAPDKVKECRYA